MKSGSFSKTISLVILAIILIFMVFGNQKGGQTPIGLYNFEARFKAIKAGMPMSQVQDWLGKETSRDENYYIWEVKNQQFCIKAENSHVDFKMIIRSQQ